MRDLKRYRLEEAAEILRSSRKMTILKKTGRYDRNQLKNHLKRGGEFLTANRQSGVFNIFHRLPIQRSSLLLEELGHSTDDLSSARIILNNVSQKSSKNLSLKEHRQPQRSYRAVIRLLVLCRMNIKLKVRRYGCPL